MKHRHIVIGRDRLLILLGLGHDGYRHFIVTASLVVICSILLPVQGLGDFCVLRLSEMSPTIFRVNRHVLGDQKAHNLWNKRRIKRA